MQISNQKRNNDYQKNGWKLQWLRCAVQLSFLLLLAVGFYSTVRTFFIILLPLAFLAGNYFCGWICPFGTAQEVLGKFGSLFIKKKLKMPAALQLYLQYSRYVLAGVVLLLASTEIANLSAMNAYRTFFVSVSGKTAQTTALAIMGSFLIVALFFERPFCNYFCAEGIKYGVASLTRIFTIKRNKATCVHCKQCDKACPMNIEISAGTNVRNAQCINCFKCIEACPVKNTLTYGKVSLIQKKEDK